MLNWTMKSFKKLSEKEITSNQITKSSQAYLKKWLQIFTLDIFICYTILFKIIFLHVYSIYCNYHFKFCISSWIGVLN